MKSTNEIIESISSAGSTVVNVIEMLELIEARKFPSGFLGYQSDAVDAITAIGLAVITPSKKYLTELGTVFLNHVRSNLIGTKEPEMKKEKTVEPQETNRIDHVHLGILNTIANDGIVTFGNKKGKSIIEVLIDEGTVNLGNDGKIQCWELTDLGRFIIDSGESSIGQEFKVIRIAFQATIKPIDAVWTARREVKHALGDLFKLLESDISDETKLGIKSAIQKLEYSTIGTKYAINVLEHNKNQLTEMVGNLL